MLLPMLKALSEILEGEPSKDTIGCARKVLKEIIGHLEIGKNEPIPYYGGRPGEKPTLHGYIDPQLSPEANQAKDELLGNQED